MTEDTGTAKVKRVRVDKYGLSPSFSKVRARRTRLRGQMKELSQQETTFLPSNPASII